MQFRGLDLCAPKIYLGYVYVLSQIVSTFYALGKNKPGVIWILIYTVSLNVMPRLCNDLEWSGLGYNSTFWVMKIVSQLIFWDLLLIFLTVIECIVLNPGDITMNKSEILPALSGIHPIGHDGLIWNLQKKATAVMKYHQLLGNKIPVRTYIIWGILLKCRFWFSRSIMRSEALHF